MIWRNTVQLDKLKEITKIATADGNWNANEYMFGMANGLILAEAIMENKSPVYLEWENTTEDTF